MKTPNDITFINFLDGFAVGAELPRSEADEQWAGFSRQLSDSDRMAIESGEYKSGVQQGEAFYELFKSEYTQE